MAITQQRNEFKVLILVLLGIPLISSTNIDCHGKSFHCINSTHFMICVDLGGGVLTTVDDYVIRCPPPTVCEIDNRFECEFPTATTPAVNIRTTVTNDPTTSNTLAWEEIAVTTILPINNVSESEYSNLQIYNTFNTVNPITSTTAGTTTIKPALEGNRSSSNVETVANIKNIVPKNLETSTESMLVSENSTIELIPSVVLSQQNTSSLETTTGSYLSEITSTIESATIPFTPSEIFSEQTTSILAINNVTVNTNLTSVDNATIIARNVSNVPEGSETSTTATLFASTTSNILIDNKLENSTGVYFTNISSSTVEENTTSSANVSSTKNITNRNISNPVNITETGSTPDNTLPQSNQSIYENDGETNLSSTALPSADKYWDQSTMATRTVDNINLQNEYNLSSNKTVVPAEELFNATIAVSEQGSENSVPQTTTSFLSVEQWTQPITETLNTASESSTIPSLETITEEQWTKQIPIPKNVSLETNLEQGNLIGNLNVNKHKDDGKILSNITTTPTTQQPGMRIRNQTIVEISTEPSIAYGNKTTNYIALTTDGQINQPTTEILKNDTLVITTTSYLDVTTVSSANEKLLKVEETLVNETIFPTSQNSTSQDTNYNVTSYSTISPLETTISANIVNESIFNTTITISPATFKSFEATGGYSTTKDVVLENTTSYSTDSEYLKNENLLKTISTSSPFMTETYQHSTTKDSILENTSTYSSGSAFVTTISYDENTLNNNAAQTTSPLTDPWNQHIAENITIQQKPLENGVNYSTDPSWAVEISSSNSTINESTTDSGGSVTTTTASPIEQWSNRATSPSIEEWENTNVRNKSTKNEYLDNTTQSNLSTETVVEQVKPPIVINPELKYNKSDDETVTIVAVIPPSEEQWKPSISGASTSRTTIIPLVDFTQPIIESSTIQSDVSIKETFSTIGETATPGLLLQNESSPPSKTNNAELSAASTNAYTTVPKTESKVTPNTPASVVEGNMFTTETILSLNPDVQNNTMATTNNVTTDQLKEVTKLIMITNSIPSNDTISSTVANENSIIHNPLAYTIQNTEAIVEFYTPSMPNVYSTSDIGIKTDQVIEQRTEIIIGSTEASNIATVVETTDPALRSSNNIMTLDNNLQSTKSIYYNEEFSGATIASRNAQSNSDFLLKSSADNVASFTTESNFIKQSTFATSSVINTSTVTVTESVKVTNSKSDMKNTTPETTWQGTQSLRNSSATELISTPSGSTPTDTINSLNTLDAADPNNTNYTKQYTDNRQTDIQTATDSIISTSNPTLVTITPLQTTERFQGLEFTKESVSPIGQSDANSISSKTTSSILQENNITDTQEVQVTLPSETSNNVEAPLVTATVTDPTDKITLNNINEFDSSSHGINRIPGTLVTETANTSENNLPTNNIPVNTFENGNTASANNGLGKTSNNVEAPLVTATVTDPTDKITLNNINEFDSSSQGINRIPGTLVTETANTSENNLPTNNIPVNTFENGNTASANNGLGKTSNNVEAPLVTATVTDPTDKITLNNINEFDSSSHGINRIPGTLVTETANTSENNLPTNDIPVNTFENGNTASANNGLGETSNNVEAPLATVTITDPTDKITLKNINEFDSSSHGINRIPGTLVTETANTSENNLPTNDIPVNTFENGNTASANNGLGETSNNVEAPLATVTITDPTDKITLKNINEFDSSSHGVNRIPGTLVTETANTSENNLPTNNIPVNTFENGNTASANNGLGETSNNVDLSLVTATITDPTDKITLNNINEFDSSSHGINRIPGTLVTETTNTSENNLPTNIIPVNTFENGNTASANNGLGGTSNNVEAPLVTALVTDPTDKITLNNINEFDSLSHGVNRITGTLVTETANTSENNLQTNNIPVNTLENGNTASANNGLSEPESNKEQPLPTDQHETSTHKDNGIRNKLYISQNNSIDSVLSESTISTTVVQGAIIVEISNKKSTIGSDADNFTSSFDGQQKITDIGNDTTTTSLLNEGTNIENEYIGNAKIFTTVSPQELTEIRSIKSTDLATQNILSTSGSQTKTEITNTNNGLLDSYYSIPATTIPQATTSPYQHIEVSTKNYESSSSVSSQLLKVSSSSHEPTRTTFSTKLISISTPHPEPPSTGTKNSIATGEVKQATTEQTQNKESTTTQRTSTESLDSISQSFNGGNTDDININNYPEQKNNYPTVLTENVVTTKIYNANVTVPTQAKEMSSTTTQSSDSTSQSFYGKITHVQTTNNNLEQKKNDPTAIKNNIVTTKIHGASATVTTRAKEISLTTTQRTSTQSSESTSQSFNVENRYVQTTNNNPEQKKNDPTAIKDNVVTTKIHDASVTVPTQAKEISSSKTQRTSTQSTESTNQSFNGGNTRGQTTNNNREKKNEPTAKTENVITTKIYDASETVPTQAKEISSTTTQRTSTQSSDSTTQSNYGGNIQVQTNLPIESPGFNCQKRIRGRFADVNDCKKFYICFGHAVPIIGYCPNNTVFSETRTQCTKNLSHCVRNNQFKCITQGRFSDYLKDNIYYICVKNKHAVFVRFKFQCQNGYHLNKTTVKCTENEVSSLSNQSVSSKDSASESQSATERSQKIKAANSKSNNGFECEEEGKFADPDDCRKYYVCTLKHSEYTRKKKKCDKDELFHKDKKKCVDADSYEC